MSFVISSLFNYMDRMGFYFQKNKKKIYYSKSQFELELELTHDNIYFAL